MPLTDYESALEFRELSDFQNVPILHGKYEAEQKCCSSPQHFRTGQLGRLPLINNVMFSQGRCATPKLMKLLFGKQTLVDPTQVTIPYHTCTE